MLVQVLHYSLERSSARLPEAQEKVAKATADEALVRKKVHALQDQADHLAGQLRSHAAQQRQQQQKEDDAGAFPCCVCAFMHAGAS